MKCTLTEALRRMRRLHSVHAGRLRGDHPHHLDTSTLGLTGLTARRRAQLTDRITTAQPAPVDADTPAYLVTSDGDLIAWLTVNAAVIAPDMPLSRNQAKHQRQAADALGDLDRHTLADLADARERRENRPSSSIWDHQELIGALRVATPIDPTRTTWVRVDGDTRHTHTEIARETGWDPDDTLIITAVGYGRHGDHTRRLSLDVLCAINAIAAEHRVPLHVIGDWVDDPDGLGGKPEADTLHERFRNAHLGRFESRGHYTCHRMGDQGWTEVMRRTGIEEFFDTSAYQHHLFTREVTGIDRRRSAMEEQGIDVFHRLDSPTRRESQEQQPKQEPS